MEHQYLALDHEFKEAINQFPVLKDFLVHRHFELEDLRDEETIENYFLRHNYSEEELILVLRQMERTLKRYFCEEESEVQSESTQEQTRPSEEQQQSEEE